MSAHIGRKIGVGLGKETVRGTAVNPSHWVYRLDLDVQRQIEKVKNESAIGVVDKNSGADIVKVWSEGGLGGKITSESFGLILLGVFGTLNSAVNADASGVVYDHTATVSQSNAGQTLTLTKAGPVSDQQYALGLLNDLEIDVQVGDYAKFSTSVQAKDGVNSTSTQAYVEETEWTATHANVKIADNLAGLGAAATIPVESVKISVAKDVEPYWAVGTSEMTDNQTKAVEVTGEFVLRYESKLFEDMTFDNDSKAFELTLANTDVTIGTAANPTITVQLPKAIFDTFSVDMGNDDIVMQTIAFTGHYDLTESKSIDIKLTNTTVSY